jgi:hypothetical protein
MIRRSGYEPGPFETETTEEGDNPGDGLMPSSL